MNKRKLTIQRLIETANAITLIGDGEFLDALLIRRISKLKNSIDSVLKIINKRNESKELALELAKSKMKESEYLDAMYKHRQDYNRLLEDDEEVGIPDMKFEDFIAKEDRRQMFLDGKREIHWKEIKKGQLLAPARFFSLMGDLIVGNDSEEGIGINVEAFEKKMRESESKKGILNGKPVEEPVTV